MAITVAPAAADHKKLMGECSVGYLSTKGVAEKISQDFPEAKLFTIVRHPLDRAIAQYEHAKLSPKGLRYRSCADYLTGVPKVQLAGLYGLHLERYFSYYSPLQLHVILYDDLLNDPLKTISDLYTYFEIDGNYVPKALAHFVSPPEEPKHRSLLSKGINYPIKLYHQTFDRAPKPIFQKPFDSKRYFQESEMVAFKKLYAKDATTLSNLIHRDMVVEWNLY